MTAGMTSGGAGALGMGMSSGREGVFAGVMDCSVSSP